MRAIIGFLAFAAIVCFTVFPAERALGQKRPRAEGGPLIGVLLFKKADSELRVACDDSRLLQLETTEGRRFLKSTEDVRFSGASALISDQRLTGAFRIRVLERDGSPARGARQVLRMENKVYEGVMDFFPPKQKQHSWLVVNRLGMERYLCGVLDGEMHEDFALEALKAQAIASRTYALYQMRKRGERARYHLRSDTSSQLYGGIEERPRIARAVAETRGQVLTFEGRLFESYYHSTCGGATVSAAAILGGPDIEPLGSSSCGYCSASKVYRWQTTVSREQVQAAVKRVLRGHDHGGKPVKLGEIESIRPVDPGPGGHAAYLLVKHRGGRLEVDAHRFRLALLNTGFNKLRSSSFACQPVEKGWHFKGRGWGHGAGMCQMGASGLANNGHGVRAILTHYYRGAAFTRAWQ